MSTAENRLPGHLFARSVIVSNELGWAEDDLIEVVTAAREIPLAIIGGQVMYALPDGTCELYWLSYDPKKRRPNENWVSYCNRSADECIDKFSTMLKTVDINREAITAFPFLREKAKAGINIDSYKIFVLYFDDSETPG